MRIGRGDRAGAGNGDALRPGGRRGLRQGEGEEERGGGRPAGEGAAGAGVCQGRANCSAATLCPASAQMVARRSTNERFSQYAAPGSGCAGRRSGSSTVARPPGAACGAG